MVGAEGDTQVDGTFEVSEDMFAMVQVANRWIGGVASEKIGDCCQIGPGRGHEPLKGSDQVLIFFRNGTLLFEGVLVIWD